LTDFRFWIALGALGWRFANPPVRLGEHVVDAQSCRLSNFLYRARPRDLARVPVQVIRTFDLPLQPHVYPAARYVYSSLQSGFKRLSRRLRGRLRGRDVSDA
jgi:hypothetical protein